MSAKTGRVWSCYGDHFNGRKNGYVTEVVRGLL